MARTSVVVAAAILTQLAAGGPAGADPVPVLPEGRIDFSGTAYHHGTNLLVLGSRLKGPAVVADAGTGEVRWALPHGRGGDQDEVEVSSGGKMASICDGKGVVAVWDLTTGRPIRGPEYVPDAVAAKFSPDETRWLLCRAADSGSPTTLFETKSLAGMTPRALAKLPFRVDHRRHVAWFPDGKRLALGGRVKNLAEVVDANTGESLVTLRGHTGLVSFVGVTPDGTRVVTAAEPPDHRAVVVWDARTGEQVHVLEKSSHVTQLGFSPDGKRMMAGVGADDGPYVWDLATGKLLQGPDPKLKDFYFIGATADGAHYIGHKWGVLQYRRARDLAEVAKVMYFEGSRRTEAEWLVVAPDGRFDGSEAARRLLRFRDGETVLPSSNPRVKDRYTPGLLAKALKTGKEP